MCRNLISVDWRGYVYDCDFNQMLDLPLAHGGARARAPVGPARRRSRRQPDPRRRPLLRLHRRPGIELRRRAEGSGGVKPARCPRTRSRREHAERAGRMCPADYRYPPSVFDRPPELAADVLYVVGGLYGNLAALDEIERLAARERRRDDRLQRRLPLVRCRARLVRRDRPAGRAPSRDPRQCRDRDRARATTSAPAAAAPIRRRSTRTWCAARTRS